MKFTAKHPFGASYELTREELQSPAMVQQLRIDDSWLVRVGSDWLPLPEFFRLPAEKLPPEQAAAESRSHSETRAGADVVSANAKFTPAVVFSLGVRLLGLYLLFLAFQGAVNLVAGFITSQEFQNFAGSMPRRISLSVALAQAAYLAAGLFLLLNPRVIVAFVFKDLDREP